MSRRGGAGPTLVTIYWRDIPAQVNGQSGRTAIRSAAADLLGLEFAHEPTGLEPFARPIRVSLSETIARTVIS